MRSLSRPAQGVGGIRSTVIAQAELYPLLIARMTQANGTRDSSIRGYSPALPCMQMIAAVALAEARIGVLPWYTRVPSASNIADTPSRGRGSELESLIGARRTQPNLPEAHAANCWSAQGPGAVWAEGWGWWRDYQDCRRLAEPCSASVS